MKFKKMISGIAALAIAASALAGLGVTASAAETITPQMTYVDNGSTIYGEIAAGNTATSGYNKISGGNTIGFANIGWGVNYITYLKVDASDFVDAEIKATLTFDGSGSTDNRRGTTYGVGYTSYTDWSVEKLDYTTVESNGMTTVTLLDTEKGTSNKSSTTFESFSFDVTNAFVNDIDGIVTLAIYETAAAGGYIKNPSVSIEYVDEYAIEYEGTNQFTFADYQTEIVGDRYSVYVPEEDIVVYPTGNAGTTGDSKVNTEFDIYLGANSSQTVGMYNSKSSNQLKHGTGPQFVFTSDDTSMTFAKDDGSEDELKTDLKINTWYHVAIKADTVTTDETYGNNVRLDNIVVYINEVGSSTTDNYEVGARNLSTTFGRTDVRGYNTLAFESKTGTVYFDNMCVYTPPVPAITATLEEATYAPADGNLQDANGENVATWSDVVGDNPVQTVVIKVTNPTENEVPTVTAGEVVCKPSKVDIANVDETNGTYFIYQFVGIDVESATVSYPGADNFTLTAAE